MTQISGTDAHANVAAAANIDHGVKLFGQSLMNRGIITAEDLTAALETQRLEGGRLGEVLVNLNKLSEEDMLAALADHLGMAYLSLRNLAQLDRELARSLPEAIARRFCMLPIALEDNGIRIVMADPLDIVAIDTAMLRLKSRLHPCLGQRSDILDTIEAVFHGSDMEERRLRDLIETETLENTAAEPLISIAEAERLATEVKDNANDAPVVQFVDLLLRQAVKSRASDIHIEPEENETLVRMRIDGKLHYMVPPSKKMRTAVIARIKILSNLNIAERRLPQDGRLKIRVSGRDVDVRVSSIPTVHGEKIVMRILDKATSCHDLDQLGLTEEHVTLLKDTLSLPHGVVIVTGPTGSGKSTTLYAALNYLKDSTKNITTVEDPVEYQLRGINQIQVKPQIGLDFATSLRSILRQDPDIILIGEIRDKETVDIAIKASLTGHLVLSTFHTNDTPSAISRLCYMGIERYLLASTLNLVVAQRLVRRICQDCKQPVHLKEKVLEQLGINAEQVAQAQIAQGHGCPTCNGTGYLGRLPIFEFLPLNEELRDLIVNNASESRIRQLARENGWGTLLDSGVQRILTGETTAEEVISIAYTAHSRIQTSVI